jgi:hypothetical protein
MVELSFCRLAAIMSRPQSVSGDANARFVPHFSDFGPKHLISRHLKRKTFGERVPQSPGETRSIREAREATSSRSRFDSRALLAPNRKLSQREFARGLRPQAGKHLHARQKFQTIGILLI